VGVANEVFIAVFTAPQIFILEPNLVLLFKLNNYT